MRWLAVILAVLLALGVGIYVLSLAKVISPKAFILNKLENWDLTKELIKTYKIGLKDQAVIQAETDKLQQVSEELAKKQQEMETLEQQLIKKEKDLEGQALKIEASLAKLQQQEEVLTKDRLEKEALKAEAQLLAEMETTKILAILNTMPLEKQVGLLAQMDHDTITNILGSMDPKKAAGILPQVSEIISKGGE